MIHYHGGPYSRSHREAAAFYAGRHAMVSFAWCDETHVIAEVCQSFAVDNGAFTAWKSGRPFDWNGYTEFVAGWCKHPAFDWCLIPDVIDGDETANDELLAAWPASLRPHGVPVWHLHESIHRLARLAAEWPRVALGSSGEFRTPGSAKWWQRMAEAMDAVTDEHGRPVTKLHGLRMLDPKIFSELPLASADSTNAVMNHKNINRFGIYLPPNSHTRAAIIAARIEAHQSAPVWSRAPIQKGFL